MNNMPTVVQRYQKAVGKCPVCGKLPTWFNDIPVKAFCFGKDLNHQHIEVSKLVPDPLQPYGPVGNHTVWKKRNGHKV